MSRLEASAWPLAAGSASVFALAVALGGLPWQAAFTVIALAVVAWAWLSPPVAGAGLGGVAWLCVTGFDVNHLGAITVTGGDAARAAALVLAGALAATVHAAAEARARPRRADPVWADFYATPPLGDPPREAADARTSNRGTE
jgi:hypothetical protein